MALQIFINHLAFAATIMGLSIVVVFTVLLIVYLKILFKGSTDENLDSLQPYTRAGGITIVSAFLIGILMIHLLGNFTPIKPRYFWGFLISASLIAVAGLYGTFRQIGSITIFGAQVLAIAILLWAGVVIDEIRLPWLGLVVGGWWSYPVTVLWVLGLTNIYAKFDRIDGLSPSSAVIASASFGLIALLNGSAFTYLCSVVLLAASIGFLVFNWPPAKISMGEFGGAFLGFSFAVMAIIAGLYDHSHTSLLTVPLLLFHFIFDSIFTFLVRVFRAYNPSVASQGAPMYLYQKLAHRKFSDRKIIAIYTCMGIAQGVGALVMTSIGDNRIWVFLPFLMFQAGYAYWLSDNPGTPRLGTVGPAN